MRLSITSWRWAAFLLLAAPVSAVDLARAEASVNSTSTGVSWDTCRFTPPLNADIDGPNAHSWRRRERLAIRALFWFHIPKTGLDFERHIRKAAGYPPGRTGQDAWNSGHSGLPRSPSKCLSIPWSELEPAPICGNAVGFFRAPDQRLMSAYFHTPQSLTWFDSRVQAAHAEMLAKGWGLGRRLEGILNISRCDINGVQTKMLLGFKAGHMTHVTGTGLEVPVAPVGAKRPDESQGACDYLDPRLVAQAVVNLESSFPFVGLTGDWWPSLCLFRALVGDDSPPTPTRDRRGKLLMHTGGAHKTVTKALASSQLKASAAKPSPSEVFAAYARLNPRCEGLDAQEERLCAVRSLDESTGLLTYRTENLIPGYADCADEVVYVAAARRRWQLARRAARAGAVLLPSLLERPARALPEACHALHGEVEAALRLMRSSSSSSSGGGGPGSDDNDNDGGGSEMGNSDG